MSTFTATELAVMKILWEHGEQKPAEIQGHYRRPVKNAALRFQLKVLLEKGHISRRKQGKAYFYKAVTPRRRIFKKMVRQMVDVYARGSTAGFIAELIKTEKLSEAELSELKQLADSIPAKK